MRILLRTCIRRGLFVAGWYVPLSLLAVASFQQQPAERIKAEIDDAERTTIPGSHSPMARAENETGRMAAGTALHDINIVFSRTPAQEADLQALLVAQQDQTSPSYHQWLTLEEFGARFGVADADIAKVRSWLEKRGFTIDGVSRSKNRITFSGTVEQVEATFGTEMHYYKVDGETHFAASQDVSVPAALSSLVLAVTNLSTFRPKPHVRFKGPLPVVRPDFTSSQTQSHFLTPKDVATIYDITPAYNAGYNGAGQSIAVVGQSDIVMADIENFQTAAGFTPVKDPVRVLASSTAPPIVSGDEAESDIDLEYTSTIANGATIYFVYSAAGAFDAITYAVHNQTAPIISVSYGLCETALGSSAYSTYNSTLAQAASQGQSVIVASGDSGSTDCFGETGLTTAQQQALAVDFPASSQYVTGMGGTEFPAADVATTNTTYWQAASGTDVISSALSYIPEQVWNDDTTAGKPSSGGGGVSTLTSRPTWQAGVPGIPPGTFRFVPDISLSSSPANAPYLFCSSDSAWTGVPGSCSHGFRDTNNTNLTAAGGTSFAAPIFAGMLAIVNQKLGKAQGLVNPTLYMLAANATTYPSAFHDITSGGNQCAVSSTTICSGAAVSEYAATTGYDEASGLGSIDFFNLLSAWPGSSTAPVASKTTLSAATTTPTVGASDAITITVASAPSSSTATPTGTLTIVVDGATQTTSLALLNGTATYSFSSTMTGSHLITATYSGNSTYAASTGSLSVTVTAVVPVASKTTLSAATTTPIAGASDAITITVASGSSSSTATPTGTVTIAVDGATQTPTLTMVSGSVAYSFSSAITGSHTITATYSGDSTYAPSSGSVSVTVTAAAPITSKIMLSAATATPTVGASDAITITVASGSSSSTATPTGTVTIAVDGATQTPTLTLANGSANYSFSSTATGSHTITASYSGNSTYAPSSGSVSVTVSAPVPVASKTTLSTATATPTVGASDAITITVAPGSGANTATPTGNVTILVDGTTQTTSLALVNGSATYSFSSTAAGSHAVTANYQGDSTYAGSSGSVSLTVNKAASQTTVSAATTTPASGAIDAITITVASGSASSTATPTGPLTIAVDGTTQSPALTLAGGSATYTFSSAVAGSHTILATYPGDSIYMPSSNSVTVTVLTKAFKLAATSVTVSAGNSGTSTVTITPQNGYAGTVAWTVSSSPVLSNGCLSLPNTTVSGSAAVMATLTVNTVASACTTPAIARANGGGLSSSRGKDVNGYRGDSHPLSALPATQASMATVGLMGLLLVGVAGRRSRRLGTLAGALILVVVGLTATGCASGGASSAPPSNTPATAAKGTYTVTIVGTDTASPSITATTTVTLTIN